MDNNTIAPDEPLSLGTSLLTDNYQHRLNSNFLIIF